MLDTDSYAHFHRCLFRICRIAICKGDAQALKPTFCVSRFLPSDRRTWILGLYWLLGLLLGIFFTARADDTYLLLMRQAACCRVSITGLAAAVGLPFLFCTFAASAGVWLIPWICLIKAFLFSSCAAALTASFGSAGWLVRLLLQFSDGLCLPLLLWFSARVYLQKGQDVLRDLRNCLIFTAATVWIDYRVISPFLVSLIEY